MMRCMLKMTLQVKYQGKVKRVVRVYDGWTLLFNLSFDVKRMVEGRMDHRKVLSLVRKRLDFLENRKGSRSYKVKW